MYFYRQRSSKKRRIGQSDDNQITKKQASLSIQGNKKLKTVNTALKQVCLVCFVALSLTLQCKCANISKHKDVHNKPRNVLELYILCVVSLPKTCSYSTKL